VTRALITGATGFAGSYLVAECRAAGWEVHGTCWPGEPSSWRPDQACLHPLDLRDAAATEQLLVEVAPERVFHLAAQASVGASWADPAATLTDNLLMTLHVLSAVRTGAPAARTLVVCSSEEYGRVAPADLPIGEEQPLRPADPYAVSKVAVDFLALQHFLAHGMYVVRVRPFNHIGPRQRQGFVVADFASQLVAIERGIMPPVLHVGNLDAARDFTDVRDVVRAYRLALERGAAGAVYNVCSGRAVRIGDLLQILISACHVAVEVRRDPAKERPVDTPIVVGSSAALAEATGWKPRIPIETTLQDILAYWRQLAAATC
jgi:GDP-4-dehydro-6-deoxy-D-mannose reductase